MSDTTDHAALSRGARAKALLTDELLIEALHEVENAAHRMFSEAAGDPGKLQRASDMLAACHHFTLYLTTIASKGAHESNKLERRIAAGKRMPAAPALRGVAWRA